MSATVVEAPRELIVSLADLRFPRQADAHLRRLMDLNTDGSLDQTGREELAALAELSERMSLLRAEALRLLGLPPT